MIYFIQGETGGPIKIGSSSNPWQRAADLQTGNPAKLRVLTVVPGERQDELALHARFSSLRIHGEWFEPAPALVAFIDGAVAAQRTSPPVPLPVQASVRGLTVEQLCVIAGFVEAQVLSDASHRALSSDTSITTDELIDLVARAETLGDFMAASGAWSDGARVRLGSRSAAPLVERLQMELDRRLMEVSEALLASEYEDPSTHTSDYGLFDRNESPSPLDDDTSAMSECATVQ